jgi:pyruvate/2-oxoglutarate dehydrogenase complex dihydrolipoamide acyltransferase (E2) component
MPTPLRAPRLNNNDDVVRLQRMLVETGAVVRAGDAVAEVVTDKATVVVETEQDGHVVEICAEEGQTIDVGSILLWVGDSADDRVALAQAAAPDSHQQPPTMKAQLLLAEYGIDAAAIPASGARLSASDVEAYVTRHGLRPAAAKDDAKPADAPQAPGILTPLTPAERGMLRSVCWHRDAAVPGYLEVHYDPEPWRREAEAFQERHQLLFNPLLGLMAWRLAQIAAERPHLNATIVQDQRYTYDHVNVGLTVQSPSTLYLVVVHEAERLTPRAFCDRLTGLQRQAMRDELEASQVSGATLAFSSMARWNVTCHMPVLPPQTSVIVAHTASAGSDAVLGATYDHRLLGGALVAELLDLLGRPPAEGFTHG